MLYSLAMIQPSIPLFQYIDLPAPATPWLVDKLIPVGGLVNLYGRQKGGKSFLAMQLALALALGHTEWLGRTLPGIPTKVLYVQLDTPRSLWQDRFKNLREAGVIIPDGSSFVNTPSEYPYQMEDKESAPYPFDILQPSHQNWLKEKVSLNKPELVILDILREVHRGDENDAGHMQQVLAQLDLACRPAAILMISHGKKPPSDPAIEVSLLDEGRGSSHVSARCDTIIRLRSAANGQTGTLSYQGRAAEETSIKLKRDLDTLFWLQAGIDPFKIQLNEVLSDKTLSSDRLKAQKLSELSSKSLEACRHAIRDARKIKTP